MRSWSAKRTLLLFVFLSANGFTQHANIAQLQSADLKQIAISNLDWRSIPALVVPESKQGQVFVLHTSGVPDLTIVPVTYLKGNNDPDPNPVSLRCGVYLLSQNGPPSFVKVLPSKVWDGWCTGIEAVAKMPDAGARPRLLFSFYSSTEGNHKNSLQFVLSWNEKKNSYQLNESQSEWLLDEPFAPGPGGLMVKVAQALLQYQPIRTTDNP